MAIESKIIMYDSPEAAKLVTVEVYEVYNPNGIIYTKDEKLARYNNCTHKSCDCGKPMAKGWTKCEDCRHKSAVERYNALPFREWDGKEPVCTWDGDKYFFSEDDIIDYMMDDEEEPIKELDLLICAPIKYRTINLDNIADDTHEDWEPEDSLTDAVNTLNEVIKSLNPHSWTAGKVRTKYILSEQD